MKSLMRPAPRRLAATVALTSAAVLGMGACGSAAGIGGDSKTVDIVAFSTPKPVYDALESAFQRTAKGQGVQFSSSFDASGSQSKAVAAGHPADYVNFSTGPDMSRLVPDFVDAGWAGTSTKGIVADSVVVIVVRKGNPKHITGWADLVKPGIQIVTPDPASSGSAKWNALAAYSHVLADGGTQADAKAYLAKFFRNVVSKPDSGSNAAKTFESGTGDALISYESEAITAKQKGESLDYVVPRESFLIETPVAVTTKASSTARSFLDFAMSAAGQKIFASKGWRPAVKGTDPGTVAGANDPTDPYPAVAKLTTVADLGGWDKVNKQFFDDAGGIVTKIENASG
ncbi:MAG: extracellular solute-binding protein [Jatrophihabitantaceae bacterium]